MDPTNRRDFLRAEVRFPAMCRTLTPREVEKVKRGILSPSYGKNEFGTMEELMEQIAPGSGDEPLYRCFQVINNKLDFIIDRLLYTTKADGSGLNEVVEISGSGIKFKSTGNFSIGSHLKMDLIIPGSLQFIVSFILQVVRVEEDPSDENGNECTYAGGFVEIDEASREAIIKAVFRTQRKAIRMEKNNREEF